MSSRLVVGVAAVVLTLAGCGEKSESARPQQQGGSKIAVPCLDDFAHHNDERQATESHLELTLNALLDGVEWQRRAEQRARAAAAVEAVDSGQNIVTI